LRVCSTLDARANAELSALTGFEFAAGGTADVYLVVRRCPAGGVDDPAPHIVEPEATLVVAGPGDPVGLAFARAAAAAGVPKSNIVICPPGVNFTFNLLADELRRLASCLAAKAAAQPAPPASGSAFFWGTDAAAGAPLQQPALGQSGRHGAPPPQAAAAEAGGYWAQTAAPCRRGKDRVIAFFAVKSGVGKTTLAAALAAHFKELAERVALVDFGVPPCARYHVGAEPSAEKDGFLFAPGGYIDLYEPARPYPPPADMAGLLEPLTAEYRRLFVVLPPVPEAVGAVSPDILVAVVNGDLVQVLEPTAALGLDALYAYNKGGSEITAEEVEEMLGRGVVAVGHDPEGCAAALAAGVPANVKSEAVARAAGELAAAITGVGRGEGR